MTPEQFDEMLKAASERKGGGEPDFDLTSLAEGMKNFVEKTSGLEGAEFPK